MVTERDIRREVDAHIAACGGSEAVVEAFTFPPPPSEDLVEID